MNDIKVCPPVKRGDIEHLVEVSAPSTLVVVDGTFHQSLAVSHAELRSALSQGWQIWGLSSMGAIRAYEMRYLGMKGFGSVYEYFCGENDFKDDEVALLHENTFPYTAFTEPLVHIRQGLKYLLEKQIINEEEYLEIIIKFESMWFGERTLHLLKAMILDIRPNIKAYIDEWVKNFDVFQIKSHDLDEFLRKKPWNNH